MKRIEDWDREKQGKMEEKKLVKEELSIMGNFRTIVEQLVMILEKR